MLLPVLLHLPFPALLQPLQRYHLVLFALTMRRTPLAGWGEADVLTRMAVQVAVLGVSVQAAGTRIAFARNSHAEAGAAHYE